MRIQAAAVSAFLRGEDIEDLMTLQIDQKRAESASTLERKVINTKLGDLPNRLGRQGHNAPENGMERGLYSQPIGDTHAKPTARRQANDLLALEKPCSHMGPGGHKGGRRSVKIFRGQVGSSQKNVRTASKIWTGCPVLRRSASLR